MTQTNFLKFSNNSFKKENIFDYFQVIKTIGEGKFSKVLLVKNTKTGFMAALKVLSKKSLIN
jgi:serine/threonine protein kinase